MVRITSRQCVVLAFLGLVIQIGFGQAWEKPIAPGVTYRMEVDLSIPRIVHAIRYSLGSDSTQLKSELGGGVVYLEDAAKGRELVSQMRARTGALVAVNGDYFPFTGDPLGAMIRDGQIMSDAGMQRAAFGWGSRASSTGIMDFRASVQIGDLKIVPKGINQECPVNDIVLNTEATGIAMAKTPNVHAVLKMDAGGWQPNGTYTGVFDSLYADAVKLPIQPGNAILTASGNKADLLKSLVPGQKVTITFETAGFDFQKIDQVIGGGPFLVRNGRVDIDAEEEHFNDGFINKRHPRTAIGRTKDGDVWIAVIDGRQKISDGATLEEAAKIMRRLGCVDAINLDGGGSSTINMLGLTVNRPSDGKERPVANGLVILGPKPEPTALNLKLKVPEKLTVGMNKTIAVVDAGGNPLPNSEVLWSSSGDAWVDQGGMARPVQRGQTVISAFVRGQLLSATVAIVDAPPPPVIAKSRDSKRTIGASRGKKGRG